MGVEFAENLIIDYLKLQKVLHYYLIINLDCLNLTKEYFVKSTENHNLVKSYFDSTLSIKSVEFDCLN